MTAASAVCRCSTRSLAGGHEIELDYVADNAWLPYGLKSDAEIAARVPALLTRLAAQWSPDVVVIACNTASTIALEPGAGGVGDSGRRRGAADQAGGGGEQNWNDRPVGDAGHRTAPLYRRN